MTESNTKTRWHEVELSSDNDQFAIDLRVNRDELINRLREFRLTGRIDGYYFLIPAMAYDRHFPQSSVWPRVDEIDWSSFPLE